MSIMTKEAWSKNLRIAAMLTVCYVLGMVAAYQTTQMLVRWRGDRREAVNSEIARPANSGELLTDSGGT